MGINGNLDCLLDSRPHALDALRASAMLLGIAFHVALSFAPGSGWMVQDRSQSAVAYVFQAFAHGFRMPRFMLVNILTLLSPTDFAPVMIVQAMLLAFGFSVGVGILAGPFPSFKATRLSRIQALRYE